VLRQHDVSLQNRLIVLLPDEPRSQLLEHGELVELKPDTVLTEAGEPALHTYFPLDGFVSNTLQIDGGPGVEVALIGNEGMTNIDLVLGVLESAYTCRVGAAGRALRIPHKALRLRRYEDLCLRDLLYRYIYVRQTQLAQKLACRYSHSIEQRLALTLLTLRDRAHTNEIFMTHESLALMLGVRRESVSKTAIALQNRGLISYGRGYVMLEDAAALERRSCACYRADRATYVRAMKSEPLERHVA
jgi:CRP-like cAMP-binding protein